MHTRTTSSLVSAAAVLIFSVAISATGQPLIDCPFGNGSADNVGRGFYVPDYPGETLGIVLMRFSARTPGTYAFSLTARHQTYDGPVIGVSTATVELSGEDQDLHLVRFDFYGAPVTAGETVTFDIDVMSRPLGETPFFDKGQPCDGMVIETDGTEPPLSTDRTDWMGVTIYAGSGPIPMVYWIAVVSHAPGANMSQWRSDVSLLNRTPFDAVVSLRLHAEGAVWERQVMVAAGSQETIRDVVEWIEPGLVGSGPLEVVTDRPLEVDARVYTALAPDAECLADGTFGQIYNAHTTHAVLVKNESVVLPGLSENGDFRCNIGFSNTSDKQAVVVYELYDFEGTLLYQSGEMAMAPGAWKQENRPYFKRAGRTDIDEGYAVVRVVKGTGVQVYASLIDAVTNDAATIWMRR